MPQSILYDNDKRLVARILPNGTRQRTQAFSGLQSHYLFEDRFGRPGKGNDKGKVEGVVGHARRNFMVPVPRFESWVRIPTDPSIGSDGIRPPDPTTCDHIVVAPLRGGLSTATGRFLDVISLGFSLNLAHFSI